MRFLVVLAAAAASAALVAAPAPAATQTISIVDCYFNHGGSVTVPAGTEVIFRLGWADKNRGFLKQFLAAQTTTAVLDGDAVANASDIWGPIQKVDKKFYVTWWQLSAGTLAAPGDSTHLDLQVTLSRSIRTADPNTGKTTKIGPGPLFPSDFGCTVTAA
jgi:hypothetical protein